MRNKAKAWRMSGLRCRVVPAYLKKLEAQEPVSAAPAPVRLISAGELRIMDRKSLTNYTPSEMMIHEFRPGIEG